MEPELAQEAVETMQAAPVAGAGNEREQEKSALLDRMAGGVTGNDVPVVEEHREMPEVESEGALAVVEVETAVVEQSQHAPERKQARDSVALEFPDALSEGTELFEACQEELAYLREAKSPLADDPRAEYKIARRMSRVLGYAQRGAVREPEVPAVPVKPAAAPQRRSVRPMPTGGAPVESPATTLERRVAGAKSTGEMLELMREIGTPFEALLKRR